MNALPILGNAVAATACVYGYNVAARKGYFGKNAPFIIPTHIPALAAGLTTGAIRTYSGGPNLGTVPFVIGVTIGPLLSLLFKTTLTTRNTEDLDQQGLSSGFGGGRYTIIPMGGTMLFLPKPKSRRYRR